MTSQVVTVAVGGAVPVVLGIATFTWQQRIARAQQRQQAQHQRVLEFLTTAYASLTAMTPAGGIGGLTIDEKRGLEIAFRDTYLYGDKQVVEALERLVEEQRVGDTTANPLIAALRNQLRLLLGLEPSDATQSPSITTGWRYDEAVAKAAGSEGLELLAAIEVTRITGWPIDEILEYVEAGVLPQPIVIKQSLFWPAAAVRSASSKWAKPNDDDTSVA